MTTTAIRLNRAYVQGTVIEANLEHLRVVLQDVNEDLRDGLIPLTHRFEEYVRSLNDACIVADADEESRGTLSGTPVQLRYNLICAMRRYW